MANEDQMKTLYRDPSRALIGGVCAGIAEYLNNDVLLARIAAVVFFIMTCGLITALYVVFWAILPARPNESAFIDVKPVRASSERYDRVVVARPERMKHEKHASDGADRAHEADASRQQESGQRIAYLFPLALFALLCLLTTLAIALITNASSEVTFVEFLPIYLIPLGVLVFMLSRASQSLAVSVSRAILCVEACFIILPFTTGICTYESLTHMTNPTFLVWFIMSIFLVAALVFNNTACYVIAIVLLLVATIMSFYDFGLFDLLVFLSRVDPDLGITLGFL